MNSPRTLRLTALALSLLPATSWACPGASWSGPGIDQLFQFLGTCLLVGVAVVVFLAVLLIRACQAGTPPPSPARGATPAKVAKPAPVDSGSCETAGSFSARVVLTYFALMLCLGGPILFLVTALR